MTVVVHLNRLYLKEDRRGTMYALTPGAVFNVEPEYSDELLRQRLAEWKEVSAAALSAAENLEKAL